MALMTVVLFFSLILSLLLFIGIIFLQIFLSRKENKWVGLILPILSFLFSLSYPLNIPKFTAITNIIHILLIWLISNIPTFILLFVYFLYRKKQNKKKQIEKMNIQDL